MDQRAPACQPGSESVPRDALKSRILSSTQTLGEWGRVRAIFEEALPLSAAERADYLARKCRNDAAIRRQVEGLLSSHDRGGDFLEQPAADLFAHEFAGAALDGHRLGPYEVESRIGAGGMGEVYKARDPRLGRAVAIKVLLPSALADDATSRERFELEARAVAALNHPHICTLHDVGIS